MRSKGTSVKKLIGALSAVVVALSLGTTPAAEAETLPAAAGTVAASSAPPRPSFSMRDQYAREIVRYGQADRGVYSIAHVRELQYRLRWAGTFKAGVTGTFGPITKTAVTRYQRQEGLNPTGVANHVTWAHLIRDTIRHRGQIPRICTRAGWHACYDRSMHQVVLLRNGIMRNSWLVRGGGTSYQTRIGTHAVYYRDIDHVSGLYDSPMPYSQFFDGGQALHGSGIMTDPFSGHSHGCINMYIEDSRQLWNLTSNKRLVVTVYGAWS